ncbi:MAG TPA: hypothetical protein DIT95_21880 [Arenibacter sp.]|jgi:hypothetical protein|nr:hypothetical protein [Arenibacter sp.]|tara:strand:+ start:1277 stop:1498 length:222 start_codon:yes stop_codon:yes gene_type:complete
MRLILFDFLPKKQSNNLDKPKGPTIVLYSCKHKVIGQMDIVILYVNIVLKHFSYLFFSIRTSIFANYKTKLFI